MIVQIVPGVEINLDKCYLAHAYGGNKLPKDGYLLPNPNESNDADRLDINNIKNQTCVFFSFNAPVPASAFERFNNGPIILIPFKDVYAQLVSVNFAECAALGAVRISSDSIIVMPEDPDGTKRINVFPSYYKRMGIQVVLCKSLTERNNVAEKIIFDKSNLRVTQADSIGMDFPVYADFTVRMLESSVELQCISPAQFFLPVIQQLEPALALGYDEGSFYGFKCWLYVITYLCHGDFTTAKNKVLYFFVVNFAVKKAWRWLNKFKNLPSVSKEYFLDRMYYTYATWLILQKYPHNQDLRELKVEIYEKYLSIRAQQNPAIFDELFTEYLRNMRVKDLSLDKNCYLKRMLKVFYNAIGVMDIVDAENFIVEYAKFSTKLAKRLLDINYPVEVVGVLLKFIYCKYIDRYEAKARDRITGFGWQAEFQYWQQQLSVLHQQLNRMVNVKILPYSLRCILYSIEMVPKISMEDFFNNFQREDFPRLSDSPAVEEDEGSSQMASADLSLVCDMISEDMAKAGESLPARLKTLKTVPALIDLLSASSVTLTRLFALDAQVMQQYTIRTHTLMFYAALQEHLVLPSAQENLAPMVRKCENFWHLFNLAITLHDVGKGIGAKAEQHVHTSKIVNSLLQALHYSAEEISFIINLIDHDIIGEFCQHESLTSENFENTLQQLTVKQGLVQNILTPTQYYYLQVLFYLSDAGSYPDLYFAIMETTNATFGFKYWPNSKNFLQLLKRLNLVTDELLTFENRLQQLEWIRTEQLEVSREYNSKVALQAFINACSNTYIIANRHYAEIIQNEYDRRYGLVLS